MQKKLEPENSKKKGKFWSGLFSILDTFHIKKMTTRNFIFQPPKNVGINHIFHKNNNDLGYIFEKTQDKNVNKFHLKLVGPKNLIIPSELKIEAIKIFSKRRKNTYMIPAIYVSFKE